MNRRDMETIQDAASFCEIVCNEIERTNETSEIIDACQRVSNIVRGMDETCSEVRASEITEAAMNVIRAERGNNA